MSSSGMRRMANPTWLEDVVADAHGLVDEVEPDQPPDAQKSTVAIGR